MAGSDSALPLLAGVITRLKAFSDVTSIVGQKIYSVVPQQTAFPYIKISLSSDDWSAKDFEAMQHRVRVQAFSRKQSPVEALEIRAAVIDALEREEDNITVAGYTLVRFDKSSLSDILTEEDGVTQQSVVEFIVTVN